MEQGIIGSCKNRAGSLKDDWYLPRRSKPVFVKEIMVSQTNQQQRHFNEWPIGKLSGEVDSTSFKPLFTPQQ